MTLRKKILWFVNNCISFALLHVLNLFFHKNKRQNDSILFMNLSVLGDTLISSLILEYDHIFERHNKVYFLFSEEYISLFENYRGKITLLTYNKHKYKWSIFYRVRTLSFLNKLEIDKCFNLTSSRGISNDELALLTGANETFCFQNTWEKTPKAFSKLIDKRYDHVICKDIINEYERHFKVMSLFDNLSNNNQINQSKFLTSSSIITINNLKDRFEGNIMIAPLAGDKNRTWSKNNFLSLAEKLSYQRKILILGSKEEREELDSYLSTNTNLINIAGKFNLSELATLMGICNLFVGNDSGLTHLALRVKIPTIAIIGGGSFGKYLPFAESEFNHFFYNELDCFGCEWFCKFEQKYCITAVDVDSVYQTAVSLLNRFAST